MEINEILRALRDLAHDAEINIDASDPDDIFRRDKAALDAAIAIIEKKAENTNSKKIMPCPFCRSTNVEIIQDIDQHKHFVICNNCGNDTASYDTETDAVNLWNEMANHVHKIKEKADERGISNSCTKLIKDLTTVIDCLQKINEEIYKLETFVTFTEIIDEFELGIGKRM